MKLENYADEIITKKCETIYWGGIYKVLNRYGLIKWVATNSKNEVGIIGDTFNEVLEVFLYENNKNMNLEQ